MQPLKDDAVAAEKRAFMKAVLHGLADIEEGRTVILAEVKDVSEWILEEKDSYSLEELSPETTWNSRRCR
ncbi:MAG: hypothetical protein CVU66_02585, partial [Deltaproteobacteria bacterium HGW-Deltaproteobacteria-23]